MKKESRKKRIKRIIGRVPLPKQTGGPQTTKHGERGYQRSKNRKVIKKELEDH